MARDFNGSILTFNGAVARIKDIKYKNAMKTADVTSIDDGLTLYAAGKPDVSVTVTIVGSSSLAVGATGTVAITWADGASDNLPGTALLKEKNHGGSLNSECTTDLTFVPCAAGAT